MKQKLILSMILSLSVMAASEAQTIRNASNAQVGTIERDGTIRNRSNSQIGKVESDGTVRDASNSKMGSAPGIKKEWVAVFFFFDF